MDGSGWPALWLTPCSAPTCGRFSIDGFFHADPHPGNVLLTADHRLGLVDVGMIGRLSNTLQERLLRLLLAIADGDDGEAAAVAVTLGEPLDEMDAGRCDAASRPWSRSSGTHAAHALNVGRVMLDLARSGHRFGLRMPSELPLLGKTLLNLHDIGGARPRLRRERRAAAPRDRADAAPHDEERQADPVAVGRARTPRVRAAAARAGQSHPRRGRRQRSETESRADRPRRHHRRAAKGGQPHRPRRGARRVDHRRRHADAGADRFTILGYPGFAMLLFLAAVAGGVWLAWTILADDVRRPVRR